MSEEGNQADRSCCCASCGIAEIDDIKLNECDGCDLVKYCSDDCKEDHKSEHEEACKQRAAELRDEVLLKQPESCQWGDCPICMIPLPLDLTKAIMMNCCSKLICDGCFYANRVREAEMRRVLSSCPFCRKSFNSREEAEKMRMKRVEANDPIALCGEGEEQFKKGDYHSAFEYWTNAAELGDAWAHHRLAKLYREGKGVGKDEGKSVHHLEEAAIGGHPTARQNLGVYEWNNGNIERAVKHWVIAATQGDDDSIKAMMEGFKEGFVNKEDLTVALRAHKAAIDATISAQRKTADGRVLAIDEQGRRHMR